MTNSFLTSLSLASTPTDMRSVGFFGDSAGSGGYKITGDVFQKIMGRHSTTLASSANYSMPNGSWGRIPYDTVVGSDSLGAFNASSTGMWSPPYNGYYEMMIGLYRENNSEIDPRFVVVVNSVVRRGTEERRYMRGGFTLVTEPFSADAGDRIEILVNNNFSGVSLVSSGGQNLWAELKIIERTA